METKTLIRGNILIAAPVMSDNHFYRSVILLSEHNEHGSVGFILNKPIFEPVKNLVTDLKGEHKVYYGGPVEDDNIYYIHTRPDLIKDSEQIYDGLYWSGDFTDVKHAVNNGYLQENEIRFYLGYTGWANNQLKDELEERAWKLINDKPDIFKNWDIDLWKEQMTKLGGRNLLWLNAPRNPKMN